MSDDGTEIEQWMDDVANKRRPKKKLVFDPKTKKLVAMAPEDIKPDENLEFTPQEAERFQVVR